MRIPNSEVLRMKCLGGVFVLLVTFASVISTSAQKENACLIEQPLPEQPKNYGTLDAETAVMFRVEFLSSGSIGKVAIVKSSNIKRLDELARDAVDKVQFKPKQVKGSPVNTSELVYYRYSWRFPGWRVGRIMNMKPCS